MVEVFREVRRVMRDDGTLWLNMGDGYGGPAGNTRGPGAGGGQERGEMIFGGIEQNPKASLRPKNLIGMPWRLALALQADGWYLRSDIIWAKPNPMPESCTDRPTKSHEHLFLLTVKPRYYYDAHAVRERNSPLSHYGGTYRKPHKNEQMGKGRGQSWQTGKVVEENPAGRNLRDVWTIPTEAFPGEFCTGCQTFYAGGHGRFRKRDGDPICPNCGESDKWLSHYATFPRRLVEPCIKAGTSDKGCCPECGKGWERVVEKERVVPEAQSAKVAVLDVPGSPMYRSGSHQDGLPYQGQSRTLGWRPQCSHRFYRMRRDLTEEERAIIKREMGIA